jgi:antitoxin YefM
VPTFGTATRETPRLNWRIILSRCRRLPRGGAFAEDGRPRLAPRALDAIRVVRHNCGVTSEPLRAVRDHLSEIVDRVEREHDRVVITRNGREAAVLLSAADLAELEETLSVLSDPEALADIREADAAYARGDVLRGIEAVRALRP